MEIVDQLSAEIGSIAVAIYQIPNCHLVFPSDPTQKRRHEDAILAYSWKEQMNDPKHDPEWIVNLPMVKGSMQTMKAA